MTANISTLQDSPPVMSADGTVNYFTPQPATLSFEDKLAKEYLFHHATPVLADAVYALACQYSLTDSPEEIETHYKAFSTLATTVVENVPLITKSTSATR